MIARTPCSHVYSVACSRPRPRLAWTPASGEVGRPLGCLSVCPSVWLNGWNCAPLARSLARWAGRLPARKSIAAAHLRRNCGAPAAATDPAPDSQRQMNGRPGSAESRAPSRPDEQIAGRKWAKSDWIGEDLSASRRPLDHSARRPRHPAGERADGQNGRPFACWARGNNYCRSQIYHRARPAPDQVGAHFRPAARLTCNPSGPTGRLAGWLAGRRAELAPPSSD